MQTNSTSKPNSIGRSGNFAQTTGVISSLIFILLFGQPTTADAEIHDPEDIQAAAEAYARTIGATPGGHIDVIANPIDKRLRLAACAEPLQTSVPYGKKSASRITVKVSCANPKPWKIFVPVRRALFQQIIVASRPLARGSILTPDDIILAESDTSLLTRGYVVSRKQAVGHKIRRTVMAGDPITPGLLETPAMIRRGQKISLKARSGALTVRMSGIARSDGMLGQVIEFENLSSKRSVQAIVRSPQSAEILLR